VLSRRDDYTLRKHAAFKGFEILSRAQPAAPVPDLFIRGAGTYSAHINADNPIGTTQSIEHTLRALDRAAADEQQQSAKARKNSQRLSGRGQPALRARGAAEGIAAPSTSTKATPRLRKRCPNLTLRLRRYLAAACHSHQESSQTPSPLRSLEQWRAPIFVFPSLLWAGTHEKTDFNHG